MVLQSVFNVRCSTITSFDYYFGDSYKCDKTYITAAHSNAQQSSMRRYYITSDINGYSLTRPHP
jgi:hypothetical protein